MKKIVDRKGQVWICKGLPYVVVTSEPYRGPKAITVFGWRPNSPEVTYEGRRFTIHSLLCLETGQHSKAWEDNAHPFRGDDRWALMEVAA